MMIKKSNQLDQNQDLDIDKIPYLTSIKYVIAQKKKSLQHSLNVPTKGVSLFTCH